MLVLLGFGAAVASAPAAVPALVTLSRFKGWVFVGAGVLIAATVAVRRWVTPRLFAQQLGCSLDDPRCRDLDRMSGLLLRVSVALYLLGALVAYGLPPLLAAQGHGPVYALSTPTLARGGWSLDVAAMGRQTAAGGMGQLRPMLSYGVTEDLQVSLSAPVPLYRATAVPPARGTTRMPATRDVEGILGWRFHRRAPGVGRRVETTAFLGASYPTEAERGGRATAPAVTGALVTGYASRTIYLWVGGLLRRAFAADGARGGDLAMASVALGWRPPGFRAEYPRADWRVFLEVLGEWSGADHDGGVPVPDSGGRRLLVAPTVLGLFGWWGVAGGPALPIVQAANGTQPEEEVRWVVNVILWF